MKKLKIILIVFLILSIPTYCQYVTNVSAVGTTAASFLEIEVGSRAIGMGGAFVAVADDASAIYWNPAGLSRLEKSELTFTHTEWLIDINFDFTGGILSLGNNGIVGLSLTALSMPDMEVRTVEEPEGTGEKFSIGSMALGFTYARNLTDRFSVGFNTKYIQERIWHMTATSFAVDFGTLFITHFKDMRLGMTISNFGTDMTLSGRDVLVYHDIDPSIMGNNELTEAGLITDKWPLPLTYRVGLAMDIFKVNKNRLTLAVDAVHPNNNTEYLSFGAEFVLNNLLFLRGGYSSLGKNGRDSEEGLQFGAGFKGNIGMISLKVDYAFAEFGRLGNIQRVTLGMEF